MRNLNLFNHAPKELVTDAFLSWLFHYLDSDEQFTTEKELFWGLFLLEEDKHKKITSVTVRRQDKNTDLIVDFNLAGVPKSILFENKTWTSLHGNQLEDYSPDGHLKIPHPWPGQNPPP